MEVELGIAISLLMACCGCGQQMRQSGEDERVEARSQAVARGEAIQDKRLAQSLQTDQFIACADDEPDSGHARPDGGTVDPNDGGTDACLTTTALQLLEELARESLLDLLDTISRAGPGERSFAHRLVGTNIQYGGGGDLVAECSAESTFDPFCESKFPETAQSPFLVDHDMCFRLGCEAAEIGIAEVYFTMQPSTDPGDRHRFTYETEAPPGTAVSDPNPLLRWRFDLTGGSAVAVTSVVDRALVVTLADGAGEHDMSHQGVLSAVKVDEVLTEASLSYSLPRLMSDGPPIQLDLEVDLQATGGETRVRGTLVRGDEPFAEIAGSLAFDRPSLELSGADCD
jgi:hypothetical protein